MPPQTTTPPLRTARRAAGNELSGRGKNQRRIKEFGRQFVGPSRPSRAETAGELLRFGIPGSCESKDCTLLETCDLYRDMRCRAKSVKSDYAGIACLAQRAKADQPCAKQRRARHVAEITGQRKTIPRIGHRVLRVAAVDRVTGESRPVTKIFPP